MIEKLFFALAVVLCVGTVQAGPSINVGTVYDYLDGDKSTYLKRIYNGADSTAFVRINIFEMTFGTDGKAIETPLDKQGPAAASRNGLIASPARLIVPVKGMHATRLLYMGERDRERYYRVRFVPVVPEKEDQFAVSEEEREAYKKTMSAGVNIMTGYGIVFFVRPKNTHFDTKIQTGLREYKVENAGNSTIELEDFKDCSSTNEVDCNDTRKHIVLPGKAFTFSKETGRVYTYNLIEGGNTKSVRIVK